MGFRLRFSQENQSIEVFFNFPIFQIFEVPLSKACGWGEVGSQLGSDGAGGVQRQSQGALSRG